ncbi:MAG: tRNA pseudouridine(38-40) synthase TruA [Crocinitomicaceae bacterium]|nr:tRNA pseudouridine(38-40) synthase TruA [Crocinitomicaceae bacterium]
MIDKTFEFIFQHNEFKTMGCSRTDAKVSANHFVFELFSSDKIDPVIFLPLFNKNLPNDIRLLQIEETEQSFNIIHQVKSKEYLYHFACGTKNHPFTAPMIMSVDEELDIDLMKRGAKHFEGVHDFRRYCAEPKPDQQFVRTVECCEIIENKLYQAAFFPDKSWMLRIKANGFLRYQVRLIMGELFSLGKGKTSLEDIQKSLIPDSDIPVRNIAPSSGLILHNVEFLN